MKKLIQKWNSINLIKRIICGLIVGIILGLAIPQASVISILGDLFVGALRGIAPLLVFFLVMSSLCHMGKPDYVPRPLEEFELPEPTPQPALPEFVTLYIGKGHHFYLIFL